MFNRQVTLKALSSREAYGGKETYTETTVWARMTGVTKQFIDDNIQKAYSAEVIILEPDATPTEQSLINYGSRDYKVIECVPVFDKDNNVEQWQLAIR